MIVCASRQLTTLLSSKIRAANGASKIMTRNRQVMVVVDQKFPTLHRSPADYYLITVCPSFRLLVKDSRKPSPPARQCKKYPKACSSSSVASIETLGNADRIDREDGGRISSIGWSNVHFPGFSIPPRWEGNPAKIASLTFPIILLRVSSFDNEIDALIVILISLLSGYRRL